MLFALALLAGASHGAGIYLASHSSTSLAYTSISSWTRAAPLPRSHLLALCEVVGVDDGQPFMVVPQDERVCLRFIFVIPESSFSGVAVAAERLATDMPLSIKYSLQFPL